MQNWILDTCLHHAWNILAFSCSCLDALMHPFLCGPKWQLDPSVDIIRWGLGSTTFRMAEDYIYVRHQVH